MFGKVGKTFTNEDQEKYLRRQAQLLGDLKQFRRRQKCVYDRSGELLLELVIRAKKLTDIGAERLSAAKMRTEHERRDYL